VRRQAGQTTAKLNNLPTGCACVFTNFSPKLDYRLMHLRLEVLFQNNFPIGQNFLNVRSQFARFRINDLEFFLDPKSENVVARARLFRPGRRSLRS